MSLTSLLNQLAFFVKFMYPRVQRIGGLEVPELAQDNGEQVGESPAQSRLL